MTERAPIKRMSGIEIDGGMLYDLAVCYAEAINAGAVPVVDNVWTQVCMYVCILTCRHAVRPCCVLR